MPKIRFTQSVKIPRDMVDEWKDYINGSVHDVSNDEAERWLRRGSAEIVTTRQINREIKLEEESKSEEIKKPEETKTEEVKTSETQTSQGSVSSSGTLTPPTTVSRLVPRT
jgi:hypothetical protein